MADDGHDLAQQVRQLLARLIRAALVSDEQHAAEERRQALRLHGMLRDEGSPEALNGLNIDGLWTRAVFEAETPDLDGEALQVSKQLTAISPISLDELAGPGLDIADLEERIRNSAATG
jgi:hypothetical protein